MITTRTTAWMFALALVACGSAPGPGKTGADTNRERGAFLDPQQVALGTGVTLQYIEGGTPGGDAVLFLHGYTDTARSFMPTAKHLLELRPDLHVFVVDQRGHGASTMPAGADCASAPERCFMIRDFAADAIAFLDAKHIARANVVGHSMGSLVAQDLALDHPDRIERAVLIGTAANVTQNALLRDFVLGETIEGTWKTALEAKSKTYPDDVYNLEPLDVGPDVDAWLAANWVTEPAAQPAFLAAIAQSTARIKLGTWIGAARALLAFDSTERLAGLTVPVLVLWGTHDVIFAKNPDQRDLLAALDVAVAGCRTTYYFKEYGTRPLPRDLDIDDIGHNLQWAIPGAVAADIAQFLRTGAPTRDLVYADAEHPQTIRVEPGRAVIVHGHNQTCVD